MEQERQYYAFISYKREDEKWAKWLQKKLEHYKLPTSIRKVNPALPETVRPIFKDTTDLSGGVLEKAIKSKAIERHLECQIDESIYEEIRKIIGNN